MFTETMTRLFRERRVTLGQFETSSPRFRAVLADLEVCARRRGPVVLTGEPGTGKTMLALALHNASPLREGPFVPVNLGAVKPDLAASELFGHKRGAFTGAVADHLGRLARAKGGTLFLDEFDVLTPDLQAMFLHAIDLHSFRPVGGEADLPLDARLVFATHLPWELLTTDRARWREDFIARLGQRVLHVPPLRDRIEDLPALARQILERLCAADDLVPPEVTDAVLAELARRPWTGNLRELRDVLDRALDFRDGPSLFPRHLPPEKACGGEATDARSLRTIVREAVLQRVRACSGNKTAAAASLQTTRNRVARILDSDDGEAETDEERIH